VQYRMLGKAGIEVSVIGYGAWGIGGDWWKDSTDEDALSSMHEAVDMGVNFIDTAMGYGDGHSERLIGQVLRDRSEQVYVATKIRPMNYNFSPKAGDSSAEAFTKEWIIDNTEQSLKNLGQEQLDMQMLHVWLDEWAAHEEWQEAIVRLKEQGKVRSFGLSLVFPLEDIHIPRKAIETGLIDLCQVVYNIYQQEPQEALFPLAQEHNIGIVARCPLDEGSLCGTITQDTTYPEEDWRNNYFGGERREQVIERAKALEWIIGDGVESLPEAALRFCWSHAAVSSVIAGMRRCEHVASNALAADKGPLPPEALERLAEHAWAHNFWV
jgi:aryl-alcohol dehydrogenase-like predicted oxidoreductase